MHGKWFRANCVTRKHWRSNLRESGPWCTTASIPDAKCKNGEFAFPSGFFTLGFVISATEISSLFARYPNQESLRQRFSISSGFQNTFDYHSLFQSFPLPLISTAPIISRQVASFGKKGKTFWRELIVAIRRVWQLKYSQQTNYFHPLFHFSSFSFNFSFYRVLYFLPSLRDVFTTFFNVFFFLSVRNTRLDFERNCSNSFSN